MTKDGTLTVEHNRRSIDTNLSESVRMITCALRLVETFWPGLIHVVIEKKPVRQLEEKTD